MAKKIGISDFVEAIKDGEISVYCSNCGTEAEIIDVKVDMDFNKYIIIKHKCE